MYSRFFQLRSDPFGMTPDPACLFLTAQHREAFAGLAYAILNRRGFAVLTGNPGTGKTTLVAKVLTSIPKDKVKTSIVFHPTLSTSDFLELVLLDFGIEDIPISKAQRLTRLQSFLIDNQRQGKISTLIIDEAHKLNPRLLEEVRLLGNFDSPDQKLLQILLVGQTELDDLLALDNLRQLRQRVAIRLHIQPLAVSEVYSYVRYRWLRAGGNDPIPFTQDAIEEIARATGGIPRVINAVCDNALLSAFAEQAAVVELRHVRQSTTDLKLFPSPAAPVVEPPAAVQPSPAAPAEPAVEVTVPSPIRLPEFATQNGRPSFLARLAGKLVRNS
jgi:general secretion pathway protein A